MSSCLDRIGSWPTDIHKAITKKEILVISEKEAINFIHGSENKNKLSLYVSNDAVHVGILYLTRGKMSDMESHEGDEAGWVLDGSVQIIASKSHGPDRSVFQECYSLRTNDKFLIPEGYRHQYLNLADGTAKVLFAISPKM